MVKRNAVEETEGTEGESGYDDILNRSWDDMPEAGLLPVGSWVITARNGAYLPPKDKTNARVIFFYKAKEPMDDVDTDALQSMGITTGEYDLSLNEIAYTIWIEGPKDWGKVRDHLAIHGVETEGMTLKESLKAVKGADVVAFLDQNSFKRRDGTSVDENKPTSFSKYEG